MLTTPERPGTSWYPRSSPTSFGSTAAGPLLWWAAALFLVVSLVIPAVTSGVLLWSIVYDPFSGPLPRPRATVPSQITHVFDAAGHQIAVLHQFDTQVPVARSDIPKVLKDAVVAIEDRRFYSHKGIDARAVFRALWADVAEGGYVEGGSTITQQYIKQNYTRGERTLQRKIQEVVLAGRLERKLSKDVILYRYLSTVYLGSGAYGVGAAAQVYFRKPVKELTVSEAALLAGLIQSPSHDEPRGNPGAAEGRRQLVLQKMLDQHRISTAEYSDALSQRVTLVSEEGIPSRPATLVYPLEEQQTQYPYFVDYVRRYLIAKYGPAKVYQGGLRVETALDPGLQGKAEAAVSGTLNGTSPPLEMALVSVDVKTGLVRALVGGRDFDRSQVNLALGNCADAPKPDDDGPVCIDGGGSGRQPGSAFKPFTLAKALEEGISLDRVYRGPGTYVFPHCGGRPDCVVHNAEGGGYGALPLRQAIAYSVNTVFAQLILDVGVKETAEMAHRLGLTMIHPDGKLPDGTPYGPSLTLGAAEVSPLDMAGAFSVFARRGVQLPPAPVARVVDANGHVLEDNTNRGGRRVLPQAIADNITEALKGVIGFGTGTAADIGRPNGTAGKTGTAETYTDAWFVGYTPVLSTSVWMGFSDSKKELVNIKGVPRVFGGTLPAETWKAFMTEALKDTPPADFPPPDPLVPVTSSTTPESVPATPPPVETLPPELTTVPTVPSTAPPAITFDPSTVPTLPRTPLPSYTVPSSTVPPSPPPAPLSPAPAADAFPP